MGQQSSQEPEKSTEPDPKILEMLDDPDKQHEAARLSSGDLAKHHNNVANNLLDHMASGTIPEQMRDIVNAVDNDFDKAREAAEGVTQPSESSLDLGRLAKDPKTGAVEHPEGHENAQMSQQAARDMQNNTMISIWATWMHLRDSVRELAGGNTAYAGRVKHLVDELVIEFEKYELALRWFPNIDRLRAAAVQLDNLGAQLSKA
jgi:hypothetical protein